MKRKIIVIKIGSSVIVTRRGKLDEFRIAHLAGQIRYLADYGYGVILTVSGAVATGINFLSMTNTCDRLNLSSGKDFGLLKQAVSGIGQVLLISTLNNIFQQKHLTIAQILLNKSDLKDNFKKERIEKILKFYLKEGIIPVFNENDVVDLNSFGGNDLLVAEIAKLMNAQELLILSTMEGSQFGVGGKTTKLMALQKAEKYQIKLSIINGKEKDAIIRGIL